MPEVMATKKAPVRKPAAKKVDTSRVSVSQKVSAPRKTGRKKSEASLSEIQTEGSAPKSRVISKKYLYAVAIVLALIGVLFAASRVWVVAWVDNKPITKFELYSLLEKRDEGKTSEELIVQRLLKSEGIKQRQNVTEAEIQAEVKKIEDQQGGPAQLDQILQLNRTTREDFRKLVELQLIKQKLFGKDVNITDEDVTKYIDQNKDSLPPNILDNPESSEAAKLRENAKEQLKQMKINENFNKWLEGALSSSRVVRNVPAPTQAPQTIPAQTNPQQ